MWMIRQGDVALEECPEIPEGAELVSANPEIVLAYGEATGHAHVARGVQLWKHGARSFLRVMRKDADLRHNTHGTLMIDPPSGCCERLPQREYTPAAIVDSRD